MPQECVNLSLRKEVLPGAVNAPLVGGGARVIGNALLKSNRLSPNL